MAANAVNEMYLARNNEQFEDQMSWYDEDLLIAEALEILERRLTGRRPEAQAFSDPQAVRGYLKLMLADKGHEVFVGMFLDAQHRLIKTVELARGTINAASVYSREVVKETLRLGASAVVFATITQVGCRSHRTLIAP